MATDKIIKLPKASKPKKPHLMLIPGNATAEQLADFFERLTGRRPTPKQIAAEKAKRGEK